MRCIKFYVYVLKFNDYSIAFAYPLIAIVRTQDNYKDNIQPRTNNYIKFA